MLHWHGYDFCLIWICWKVCLGIFFCHYAKVYVRIKRKNATVRKNRLQSIIAGFQTELGPVTHSSHKPTTHCFLYVLVPWIGHVLMCMKPCLFCNLWEIYFRFHCNAVSTICMLLPFFISIFINYPSFHLRRFHPSCMGMTIEQAKKIDHYMCSDCAQENGAKRPSNSFPVSPNSDSKVGVFSPSSSHDCIDLLFFC